MAIKCLLLLPVTLCFLLVFDVAAQDDDNRYAIIVNGTVTCDGNPSANLKGIPFDVVLEEKTNGRKVVIQRIGGGSTNSMGKFTIKAPSYYLGGLDSKYRYFPIKFLMVRLDRAKKNLNCPTGLKVEAYGKYNSLGTRIDFEEYKS